MLRYELMDVESNERVMSFVNMDAAAVYLRTFLGTRDAGTINRIMLVDRGAPGEGLTYPLEGAPLLAMVFGLEEDDE